MATVNSVTFLNAKIEAQGSRIEGLGSRIDAQGEALTSAIDARGAKLRSALDTRGAVLRSALDAQGMVLATHTTLLRWMMGIVIAVFAAVMILLVLTLREPQLPAAAALRQAVAASSRDTMPARVEPCVTPEPPSPAQ